MIVVAPHEVTELMTIITVIVGVVIAIVSHIIVGIAIVRHIGVSVVTVQFIIAVVGITVWLITLDHVIEELVIIKDDEINQLSLGLMLQSSFF